MATIGHAHYGGNLRSAAGRSVAGSKTGVGAGRTFRQQKRFEMIVRMENAQMPLAFIASSLCISMNRLKYMMKSPEYLATRIAITHGIIIDHDQQLATIKQQRREMLTALLPPALLALKNALEKPSVNLNLNERKHQTAVALELLDREETFAKISRTEIKPVDSFDYDRADKVSTGTLNAIRGIFAPSQRDVTDALDTAVQFSRSHTLSAVDQQEAMKALEAVEPEQLAVTPTTGSIN